MRSFNRDDLSLDWDEEEASLSVGDTGFDDTTDADMVVVKDRCIVYDTPSTIAGKDLETSVCGPCE
jgi:hypothetical protein